VAVAFSGCSDVLLGSFSCASQFPIHRQFEITSILEPFLHPGSVAYDAANQSYTMAAAAKHVVQSRRVPVRLEEGSGDVTLTADISFCWSGGESPPQSRAHGSGRVSTRTRAYADPGVAR